MEVDEFHTLNRCLDNAIADAVRAHAQGRDASDAGVADAATARQGRFIRELRSHPPP